MISDTIFSTSGSHPPHTPPEMVWTVCETADNGSTLVARWSVPDDESGLTSFTGTERTLAALDASSDASLFFTTREAEPHRG